MGNSEARLHKREVENKREKIEGHTKALETRLNKLKQEEKLKETEKIHMKSQAKEKVKNKYIVRITNLNISFKEKQIFKNANCLIQSNKITALIGENGAGKTTLVKKIMQNNSESIVINPQASIGYFSQELEDLEEEKNVLENTMSKSIESERTVKNVLANLLLKENDLKKKINQLSGGEKVKVAIAKILVSNHNFLILDEPTNFLDVESIEGLESMLKNYEGTILLITHDKELLNRLNPNLIIVDNKKLIEFDGKYEEYIKKKQKIVTPELEKIKNNKILLEFRLTKIITEISTTQDEKKKKWFEEEYSEIKKLLENFK